MSEKYYYTSNKKLLYVIRSSIHSWDLFLKVYDPHHLEVISSRERILDYLDEKREIYCFDQKDVDLIYYCVTKTLENYDRADLSTCFGITPEEINDSLQNLPQNDHVFFTKRRHKYLDAKNFEDTINYVGMPDVIIEKYSFLKQYNTHVFLNELRIDIRGSSISSVSGLRSRLPLVMGSDFIFQEERKNIEEVLGNMRGISIFIHDYMDMFSDKEEIEQRIELLEAVKMMRSIGREWDNNFLESGFSIPCKFYLIQ